MIPKLFDRVNGYGLNKKIFILNLILN